MGIVKHDEVWWSVQGSWKESRNRSVDKRTELWREDYNSKWWATGREARVLPRGTPRYKIDSCVPAYTTAYLLWRIRFSSIWWALIVQCCACQISLFSFSTMLTTALEITAIWQSKHDICWCWRWPRSLQAQAHRKSCARMPVRSTDCKCTGTETTYEVVSMDTKQQLFSTQSNSFTLRYFIAFVTWT